MNTRTFQGCPEKTSRAQQGRTRSYGSACELLLFSTLLLEIRIMATNRPGNESSTTRIFSWKIQWLQVIENDKKDQVSRNSDRVSLCGVDYFRQSECHEMYLRSLTDTDDEPSNFWFFWLVSSSRYVPITQFLYVLSDETIYASHCLLRKLPQILKLITDLPHYKLLSLLNVH